MSFFGKVKDFGVDYLLALLPDSVYLKLKYRKVMHRRLDLRHPRSFNEKLNWLKINNRRPEFTDMVDKRKVKDWVAATIGSEYVVPTLGVWKRPEDIDWDSLPDRFVLKTTHGGGNTGVVVCPDKSALDKEEAVRKLNKSLKLDLYKRFREWPYKGVEKCVIAEEMIGDGKSDLDDYKFYCFNGKAEVILLCTERSREVKMDFFDADWNHLPFTRSHPNAAHEIKKPENFDKMIAKVNKLASSIEAPFVRVDMYDNEGRIYFGEITFYPGGGMGAFQPEEWDYRLGEMIKLPTD